MATKKTTKKKDEYVLTMTLGVEKFTTKGASILACLKKIKPFKTAKSVGKFELDYKGKHSAIPVTLNRVQVVRIFTKPVELELFAKRLSILL